MIIFAHFCPTTASLLASEGDPWTTDDLVMKHILPATQRLCTSNVSMAARVSSLETPHVALSSIKHLPHLPFSFTGCTDVCGREYY